jgi:hypothetical protein
MVEWSWLFARHYSSSQDSNLPAKISSVSIFSELTLHCKRKKNMKNNVKCCNKVKKHMVELETLNAIGRKLLLV